MLGLNTGQSGIVASALLTWDYSARAGEVELSVIKTILGYEIEPGVSEEDYEDWLFKVHIPDLLANPYVDRLVFNKVVRTVDQTSGNSPVPQSVRLYRIAEMHFSDDDAYKQYLRWFADHPVPASRSPRGRTAFKFYVLATSEVVERHAERSRASRSSDR